MHETKRWDRIGRAYRSKYDSTCHIRALRFEHQHRRDKETRAMSTTAQPVQNGVKGPIKGIDLFAYFTNDPARSIAFYRDVMGMTPTEVDDEGRGAEFTLGDGTTFGVWKPDEAASGACVMLAVDDIAAAVADLRARGLAISDSDGTPVCHMAFAKDPDGNTLIVHQRK
jgi:predicted enzyme related to lactoylglutathione lyase